MPLRLTFDPRSDRLHAQERLQVEIPWADFSQLPAEQREHRLAQLIEEDAARPFDLVNGPLVRFRLLRIDSENHWLVVTTHHIVCDGWSTNVLIDELGTIYNANCAGQSWSLPAPRSFVAYAQDQARWLESPERAAVEAWWCNWFKTPVPPLELPTDRPRPSLKSFQGATARSTIDVELYKRIKRFGAQQGCTLFATLLAGFKILLHRFTGQDDLAVGIPAAGQSLLEGETLVGHCVNFLPLRSSFAGDPSVASVLAQTKSMLLDAYEHQNYTYGSLVRKLALPRDPSRLPLVETQFNLERVGAGSELRGLEVEIDPNPKCFVNFDLFFNVVESDRGLTIDCDYNRELFDPETLDRWLQDYATILKEMAVDPKRSVSRIPVLDESQRHRLLVEWNQTQVEFPREQCVHQLIEDQAARTPQAIAAVFEGQSLSYRELNQRANQLARHLQELGIGPEKTVAVCLDRSLDLIVALLGVLKAGGAYVPLDPGYPSSRIESVLGDSKTSLLITQTEVASRQNGPAHVLCLDTLWPEISRHDAIDLPCRATGDNLAYLIYTSGSTGRPKGVEVTHRNVVNLLGSMAREPGLTDQDRLLAVTTVSFDIAALELFLPLVTGARVILASRATTADGYQLLALMKSSAATVLQATPATWRLLLEAGWAGRRISRFSVAGKLYPVNLPIS